MRASPVLALAVRQLRRRATEARGLGRLPADRRQTPEAALLLRALAAAHALVLAGGTISSRRGGAESAGEIIAVGATLRRDGVVRREAGGLATLAADLAFTVALALLDFLLAQNLDLRLPVIAEAVLVEAPAGADAEGGFRRAVVLARLVLQHAPAVDAAADDARQAAAVVDHVLLQPQAGLVDRMRHVRHPLAGQAEVGAGLLREELREAGRVQQRPFEFVGVQPVLEVDREAQHAAVAVGRVEHPGRRGIFGQRLRRRRDGRRGGAIDLRRLRARRRVAVDVGKVEVRQLGRIHRHGRR